MKNVEEKSSHKFCYRSSHSVLWPKKNPPYTAANTRNPKRKKKKQSENQKTSRKEEAPYLTANNKEGTHHPPGSHHSTGQCPVGIVSPKAGSPKPLQEEGLPAKPSS